MRQPFALVFAAFFAADDRPAAPLVFVAFLAAVDFELAVRFDALFLACLESALFDTAPCPSFFDALVMAFERVADGFLCVCEAASSDVAFLRVDLLAVLLTGAFTPARRALEKPIAMACFADFAPCLPLRTCSISSCTYSPA